MAVAARSRSGIWWLAILGGVLIIGCKTAPNDKAPEEEVRDPDPKEDMTGPTGMTPSVSTKFEPGPPVKSCEALLSWLQKAENVSTSGGGRRFIRLPVIIVFDEHHLGIEDAYVGSSQKKEEQRILRLSLDDTTMGVSLMDRLRGRCPKDARWCAAWLDGHWGPALKVAQPLEPPVSDGVPTKWPFTVRSVVENETVDPVADSDCVRFFVEAG